MAMPDSQNFMENLGTVYAEPVVLPQFPPLHLLLANAESW